MARIERISCFIDGFNLYHALDGLGENHLKWLDLWELVERYAAQPHQKVTAVYYFSAFATWKPSAYKRHREYVRALQATGVDPIMGFFKEKDRKCRTCGSTWIGHEEKETDVNIGLYMVNEAYKDTYDHAFLLSNDSDLTPVVRMLRTEFPRKRIRIITPPRRRTSKDLARANGGMARVRTIKESHVRRHLLTVRVKDAAGTVVAKCPPEYLPPEFANRPEANKE